MGGSEVGGEGGAPLLQSGSGPVELRLALGEGRLRGARGAGACARALAVGAAGEVRSQGSTSVGPLGGDGRACMGLSLGLEWCSGRPVRARGEGR